MAMLPDSFRQVARRAVPRRRCSRGRRGIRCLQGRRLHCSATFHGTVIVDGELDPDGGATLIAALESLDKPDSMHASEPPRSMAQRRADALVQLAQQSLAHQDTGNRRSRTTDVIVDADTFAGKPRADLLAARCELSGVGPVPRSVVDRLSCDAAIGRVVRRGPSLVLDLGRRTPLVSPAQLRALAHRDGGCGFPGCDCPPQWCDAHHIVHWSRGCRTDLVNLVLLCRRHHVACHEGGWQLTRDAAGAIRAIPP
jgi:Domain of unknown function (DUF222)